MEENLSLQLKDIKDNVVIPDDSIYYYYGLIGLGVVFSLGILIALVLFLWKRHKINLKKGYLVEIKAIDWKSSKKSAYKATYYAQLLAKEDEILTKELQILESILEQYKYKKEVEGVDEKTQEAFNHFVSVTNGRI